MVEASHLIQLLPEVQECLSSEFAVVDVSLGPGPDLSRPPFNLPFRNLGKQITYVPDSKVVEDLDRKGLHEISLSPTSFVLTDGMEGTAMEVALQRGGSWLPALRALFHRVFSSKWTFFIAEVENSRPTFHVLSSQQPLPTTPTPSLKTSNGSSSRSYSLWILPVTRIFAVPPPPKKVRVVKKVVKKKSPTEVDVDGVKRTVTKVVKKKKSDEMGEGGVTNGNGVDEVSVTTSNGTKDNGAENERENKATNGIDDPIADTNNYKDDLSTSSLLPPISLNTLSSASSISLSKTVSSEIRNGKSRDDTSSDEDITVSLKRDIMESERRRQMDEMRRDSIVRRPSSRSPSRLLNPIIETPRIAGRSGLFMKNGVSDYLESVSSLLPPLPVPSTNIPVIVLQLIFKNYFSYQQLGQLRAVHPHWDEICGQLLNNGYYSLLEKSDQLLMNLQRRVIHDSSLHYPVALLTNIQVHILNPVDIMRAPIDEGICCFPYGLILDKTERLLTIIERMSSSGEQLECGWEEVAVLARRASLHYRSQLEQVMEDRMGTCAQLKAAHKIIRMDSMIVEANVHKLEKESVKVRDDLKWELEQLQESNSNLKKENRKLKADHLKLESRVDALEHKLKTIARLLN